MAAAIWGKAFWLVSVGLPVRPMLHTFRIGLVGQIGNLRAGC